MKKIQFVVGGTQKGGTTALYWYLQQHEAICLSKTKELHFFDRDEYFDSAGRAQEVALSAYHAKLPDKEGYRGDVTPTYMFFPSCITRIKVYNPDMKWVVLLRNPIDRAFSHYNMHLTRGLEERAFPDVIRHELEYRRLFGKKKTQYTYLERGRYSQQIRNLYAAFDPRQVLILDSSLLYSDAPGVLERLADFLELAPFPVSERVVKHKTSYGAPMTSEDREYLCNYYRCEVSELESLTGMSFSYWLA